MIAQVLEITWMNLKNLNARRGSASVIVVGIAGVVAVLLGLLSMAAGFEAAMTDGSRPDRAIVSRVGASNEVDGWITTDQIALVSAIEGIANASAELFVFLDLPLARSGKPATMVGRGVTNAAFDVRPELEIVAGRRFRAGQNELIAGLAAVREFTGLAIGDTVALRDGDWTVVGHFASDGGLNESEVWMDLPLAQSAFRRVGGVSTIRTRLTEPAAASAVSAAMDADPRLNLSLTTEADFFTELSRSRTELIETFAWFIATIMALGSIVAAVNATYAAVSARTTEIATLRALGFGGTTIVSSVLIETAVLACAGGLAGGLLVYALFDGYTASTLNDASYSQVAFGFAVTPELLQTGVVLATLLGLLGGVIPAIRASRLPITVGLRGE